MRVTQTMIYTLQTNPTSGTGTQLVYQTQPDEWIRVTLRLETGGPVVIGHLSNLRPTTSGKGRLLPSDEDIIVDLSPTSKLFIAAEGVERVGVHITSLPGLGMVLDAIMGMGGGGGGKREAVGEKSVPLGRFGFGRAK